MTRRSCVKCATAGVRDSRKNRSCLAFHDPYTQAVQHQSATTDSVPVSHLVTDGEGVARVNSWVGPVLRMRSSAGCRRRCRCRRGRRRCNAWPRTPPCEVHRLADGLHGSPKCDGIGAEQAGRMRRRQRALHGSTNGVAILWRVRQRQRRGRRGGQRRSGRGAMRRCCRRWWRRDAVRRRPRHSRLPRALPFGNLRGLLVHGRARARVKPVREARGARRLHRPAAGHWVGRRCGRRHCRGDDAQCSGSNRCVRRIAQQSQSLRARDSRQWTQNGGHAAAILLAWTPFSHPPLSTCCARDSASILRPLPLCHARARLQPARCVPDLSRRPFPPVGGN